MKGGGEGGLKRVIYYLTSYYYICFKFMFIIYLVRCIFGGEASLVILLLHIYSLLYTFSWFLQLATSVLALSGKFL